MSIAPGDTRRASTVIVRPIRADDAEACGRAGFAAHAAVARAHNVPPEQPTLEFAAALVLAKIADPHATGFVAERDGEPVGSVFLTSFAGSEIGAIGPLTVHPSAQGGVGRKLLRAAVEHADRTGLQRIRLVQSPSHLRSLALYSSTGFVGREPLVLVNRPARRARANDATVRRATACDLPNCNRLSEQILGFRRDQQLRAAVASGTASIVEHGGRLCGYVAELGFGGHAVADNTQDLQALIAQAADIRGPGFFVPVRNSALLAWLLAQGFRMLWPALLMTRGPYTEPRGAYLPAISF
jgi:predicted N-acetyltransferase YhbS